MQGMWVSVRKNINCMHSMSDVVWQPRSLTKYESHIDDRMVMGKGKIPSCNRMSLPCIFTEVGDGDLSRNVIEKILSAALTSSARKPAEIRKIFKVRNSSEVVDTFEKFREMAKTKATKREQKHTRSLVDGNELLCFHVTTITCFNREQKPIAAPCEYSNCNLCRIIGSKFDRNNTESSGMQLSINRVTLRENIDGQSKRKNLKTVVIICRIIGGRIKSTNDGINEEEYDSIVKKGLYPKSQYLTVNNPNTVLPCFAVIFN